MASSDISPDSLIEPLAPLAGTAADASCAQGNALKLTGGSIAFAAARPWGLAGRGSPPLDIAALTDWVGAEAQAGRPGAAACLENLTRPRPPFAGLDMNGGMPKIMGIVNVTPDSFSDGGENFDRDGAIAHGEALAQAGADILDIGGESSRPGADPVSAGEEAARIMPVIETLAARGHLISVDTRHATVMAAALDAGAQIINDISALTDDPAALATAAGSTAAIVLMHKKGQPRDMQTAPAYGDVVAEVAAYLAGRIESCEAAGIARARIAVDPGFGFGKNKGHNLDLLSHLGALHCLGVPLAIGVSRKSFIADIAGPLLPRARLPGSLAAALAALDRGAQILRVHDVAKTVQAVALSIALRQQTGTI